MTAITVKNRTRQVMLGLTIVTLLFTGYCGYNAVDAANQSEQASAECETLDIIEDDNWGEVCGESLGTGLAAGVFGVIAFGWFVLAVTFFLIFVTRAKYKTEVRPS